jgi:hypothetical protein
VTPKTLLLIKLWIGNSTTNIEGIEMELTIQQVHTYNNLVNMGKAEKLGRSDQLLIPRLLDDDTVVLYDLASGDTIRPGINMIQKILIAIDNYQKD